MRAILGVLAVAAVLGLSWLAIGDDDECEEPMCGALEGTEEGLSGTKVPVDSLQRAEFAMPPAEHVAPTCSTECAEALRVDAEEAYDVPTCSIGDPQWVDFQVPAGEDYGDDGDVYDECDLIEEELFMCWTEVQIVECSCGLNLMVAVTSCEPFDPEGFVEMLAAEDEACSDLYLGNP